MWQQTKPLKCPKMVLIMWIDSNLFIVAGQTKLLDVHISNKSCFNIINIIFTLMWMDSNLVAVAGHCILHPLLLVLLRQIRRLFKVGERVIVIVIVIVLLR